VSAVLDYLVQLMATSSSVVVAVVIIIIIKDIYIAQVCKGHKCAMSAQMAV